MIGATGWVIWRDESVYGEDDLINITGESVGTGDGTTTEFSLANAPVYYESEVIYVAGTAQTRGTDYTIDYVTGKITFATAPALDAAITADYTYYGITRVLDAESVNLTWNRNLEKKKSIWGVRNVAKIFSQKKTIEGSVKINATDWRMLKFVLGKIDENVTSATEAPYYHDFIEENELPSFSLERIFNGKSYVFEGLKVNTLDVKGENGKALEVSMDLVGKDIVKRDSDYIYPVSLLSLPDLLPFRVNNLATATFAGTDISAKIKSFEININNNLEADIGGNGVARTIDEGIREVSGTLTLKWDYDVADFVLNEAVGDIIIKLIRGTNDAVEFTIKDAEFESLTDQTEAENLKELELAFISFADPTTKECVNVRVTSPDITYY